MIPEVEIPLTLASPSISKFDKRLNSAPNAEDDITNDVATDANLFLFIFFSSFFVLNVCLLIYYLQIRKNSIVKLISCVAHYINTLKIAFKTFCEGSIYWNYSS